MQASSGSPDQTTRSAASGLGLYCLPTSHKKDARLIWVNLFMQEKLFHILSPYIYIVLLLFHILVLQEYWVLTESRTPL